MKQRVAITRVEKDDVEAAVRRAIELAGGLRELITPNSRVLVKPNIHKPARSGSGIITDARVTEAVTRVVLEMGPRSVVIGEGAGAGYDFPGASTEDSFAESGTLDAARRLGVEVRNLNTDDPQEVSVDAPLIMERVKIARTVLESDLIISVPVLKSHIRTHVTISLKNLKGVMPGAEKRKSHRLGLDMAIADLYSLVRPGYAVVDATTAMQGLWQYPQDCVELGLIVAGRDPLSVDIVGTSLMGVDLRQVLHLQYAAQKDGTAADLGEIELVGEPLEKHRRQFTTGFQAFEARYPQVRVIQGESACSGCSGELVGAMMNMTAAGYGTDLEGLTIVVGNPSDVQATGKTAVLGKCAREFAGLGPFAAGCPPKEDVIMRVLCEACAVDPERAMAARDENRRKLWSSSEDLLKR